MRIAIFRFGVWGSHQFKEYLEQRRRFKEDMSYAIIRNDKLTRMDAHHTFTMIEGQKVILIKILTLQKHILIFGVRKMN